MQYDEQYDDILGRVKQQAAISPERADKAVKATLRALSEQVDAEQFTDLLEQLPGELAQAAAPAPGRPSAEEFDDTLAQLPSDIARLAS